MITPTSMTYEEASRLAEQHHKMREEAAINHAIQLSNNYFFMNDPESEQASYLRRMYKGSANLNYGHIVADLLGIQFYA